MRPGNAICILISQEETKPTKPIAPGKSDKIEVVFHPNEGQLNKQSKTVRVTANTEPKETVLKISAFVEKKQD